MENSESPISILNEDDYPVKVETNEILGRHLIAKRDIKSGEILLKDNPIFMSPNANAGDENTCVGCCIIVKNPVHCRQCEWTLCSVECENSPDHRDNECSIFSTNDIKPQLPSPYCFIAGAEFIKVLRCLLISTGRNEEDKKNWELMKTLEPHVEQRKAIPKVLFMSTICKSFIKEVCKLEFDESTVDFILGVIDVNAFRHTIHPNNPLRLVSQNKDVDRNATFLYIKGSMAAHGCRRNVRWETLPIGKLQMWAAEDVKQGALLTHPYVDLMQGTPDRRRQLKDQFYFDCTCHRCSDPTELGTFFSALKCPECSIGDMLAVNPLDYETVWRCNAENCGATKSSEYERELVHQIQSEEKTALELLQFGTELAAVVGGLARILGKYRGKKVHVNHYAVMEVEYQLVKMLARMKKPKPTHDLIQEMRRLIHKFLDISAVFYPGTK